MMEMQQAARTAMAAKLIADVVTAENKPAKADLLDAMVAAGVERVRVTDAAGGNLGAVSLARSSVKAKLVDPAAFAAWVADRYPGELTQIVREAFVRKILDGATAAEAPVDVATGEVVPGVELAAAEPYVTVRPSADARDRMRDALLASGLLRLPAGGDEQ